MSDEIAITTVLAAAWEPITLAEAKTQCRVDSSADDTYISGLISAARAWCEKRDWRRYCLQTVQMWLEEWPDDDEIVLPKPPLRNVASIVYYTTDDLPHTLDSSVYFVDTVNEPGRVHLRYAQVWPVTPLRDYNAVCITANIGWDTPADVPPTIKQAIKLIVGHWYENRENSTVGAVSRSIELGALALLDVERMYR